jgi:hypothetical protein
MNPSTARALWIGGLGLAAAGTVTAVVVLTKKSAAAPASPSVAAPAPAPIPPPTAIAVPLPTPQPVQSAPPPLIAMPGAAAGPYTALAGPNFSLLAGGVYLVSLPPIAGTTLSQYVAQLQQQSGLTVLQSTSGTMFSGWPSTDTSSGNWRLVVQYSPSKSIVAISPPFAFPSSPGLQIWATNGKSA